MFKFCNLYLGPSSGLFGLNHNRSRDKDVFFGLSCCYVPENFTISYFAIAAIISSIKLVFYMLYSHIIPLS